MLRKLLPLLACLSLASPAFAQTTPNYPAQPLELKYYGNGPWTPTMINVPGCVNKPPPGGLNTPVDCEIYYPAELGTDPSSPGSSFKHPILVWGNGTGAALPGQYSFWFNHLVSWGFVVIRTSDPTALDGQTMLAAMNYMIAANANPASGLYGKLDIYRIGAAGHSQGAAGALNAMNYSQGKISTAITFELPFNGGCIVPCTDEAALRGATGGSVFYVAGTRDIISRDTQLIPGPLNSNTAFYEATPNALTKVKAMLIGADHDDVQGHPYCSLLCWNGVYGYYAYPTAWLMWRLRGSSDGPAIFSASNGELFRNSTNWQGAVSNIP